MTKKKIYSFAKQIFNYPRSITGNGVRKTLNSIKEIVPNLKIHEVPTGTKAFDWKVPKEWSITDAYIVTPSGKKICQFKKNNLHIVSYSHPFNGKLSKKELDKHLFSLPNQPNAIPYVTSYYTKRWGFCLSHNQRKKLKNGIYHAVIKSKLFNGNLTYGELIIKGKSKKEIFLSTYICHPSMANNEVSGPSVLTFLSKWIQNFKNKNYSYRIIFVPETIGSIVYISKNFQKLKKNVVAGFVLSCVGDNRNYSYLPSRNGFTLSDKISKHILKWKVKKFNVYSWLERGSDERQYCAPGVDLPVCSIMRTKHGSYPEYHTSLDKLGTVVKENGLGGSYELYKSCLEAIEYNCKPKIKVLCEPFLSKRNLYPNLSIKSANYKKIRLMMHMISFCDGKTSLLQIAEFCKVPIFSLYDILDQLKKNNLIKIKY